MYNKSVFIFFILILFFIYSCTKKIHENKISQTYFPDIKVRLQQANQCIITGEVIKIYEKFLKDPDSPCANSPCFARIKILKIIDCNNRLVNIYPGQTIDVFFQFTLAPTNKNQFPHLKKKYPGIKIGSCFHAPIFHRIQLDLDKPQWVIFDYQILE